MAAEVKGKQVSWGISATGKTIADTALGAGIVESIGLDLGGEVAKIVDEEGDVVTRVDHGEENKIDLEVKALATSTVPKKGDELTFPANTTLDGVNLSSGRTFVDSAKVTYSGNDAKKISVSAVHYPEMGADA